jgi:hypothetical protein
MTPNIEITDLLIQLGALGVLLLVLVGVYRLAKTLGKTMLDRVFDQSDKTLEFVKDEIKKVNQERSNNLVAWLEVIEKTDAERAGNLTAWIDAHRDQLKTSQDIAATLAEMLFILRRINGKPRDKST